MQNSALVLEEEEQLCEMWDLAPDVEAQSAQCEKPHLSSSCDAVVTPASTSSDDAACGTTSDLEDATPFCIRGYAAAVREINISKCWPFSRQLLEESIKEGKQSPLPPLSPCACPVKVSPEHYQDGAGESAQDNMAEPCGATDGPQLQVQIDLSKFEVETDSHGCAAAAAGTGAPAKPLIPSSEAAPLQELQEPHSLSSKEDATKHANSSGDCPLIFKRQAPRSIREIRNSIMQGCRCSKMMGVAQACKKDSCSKFSLLSPTPVDIKLASLDASDRHSHDGQQGGDHESVSGITQLEPSTKRPHESEAGVAYSHSGSSPPTLHKLDLGEMHADVNVTNKQPVMLVAGAPFTSQVDVFEKISALGGDIPAQTRSDNTHRRCSVSDSQTVDKSHESHRLRSTSSRQCCGTTTQQGSADDIASLDNVLQQRCPICSTFQSSSNTALNVHIDRCLAASSMEEGTTKSKQKVKVRKKRSMAELCLIAPSSIVDGESALSDCDIRSQKATKKAAGEENKVKTCKKQNEVWKPESKVNTLKLLKWGPRSSTRHGASRRGPIHEARTGSTKNQSLRGGTPEWATTSVLRDTKKWKRQKTNHKYGAELPQTAQLISEEKAQKLRKFLQRSKRGQKQNTEQDATHKGRSAPQSMIKDPFRNLHGRVLSKHKAAALRAALQPSEKHSSQASKETSHVPTSDTHFTVIGSHETTVEVLHTDNALNAEIQQGDRPREKVKLRMHVHPTKQHKNKGRQKIRLDDPQEASDLQLAIIKTPSVSKKAESQPARTDIPLRQHSRQAHLGIADRSLETQMLSSQLNGFQKQNCSPENLRTAQEQPVQGSSLQLLSAIMENYQGERRKPPLCRKAQLSATNNGAPCNVLQSSGSGVSTCLGDLNDVDVACLPLGAQPMAKTSLRENSGANSLDTQHVRQQEMQHVQVNDFQRPQVSHFLSATTPPNSDSLSLQRFGGFPFSLSTTETPRWPRQLIGEQSFATAGSEQLCSLLPSHLMQSLEIDKRTFGTSSISQGFDTRPESLRPDDTGMEHTGRHVSALQKIAEVHRYNPGSTQSNFQKDAGSTQVPSFLGSSSDNTCQSHNHSQRLPPWMQAAIHDPRAPAFSSTGLSTNSSCQSLSSTTAPTNISPEMSRTLSMLQMIGSPVLRLMGKTMVLRPDVSQGHAYTNAGQFSGHSTYINFFQSLEPEEATYEAQNQDQQNRNQRPNLQIQPGIQSECLPSDEYICRNEVQSWTSSESCPKPQLQDFFCRAPSMSQIPSAHQPTNPHNNTLNMAEQNQSLLQGGSQPLAGMSHRAQLNWQYQKATNSPLVWPQASSCCPNNQIRTNLEFSAGGLQCRSFRSNQTLPHTRHNSAHSIRNVKAGNSSTLPSWFSNAMNGASPSDQHANVIILDEEGPLCTVNMSDSGQGVVAHSKQPEVSAVQKDSMLAQCRANLADLSRSAREKPTDKAFIPIIYTVGCGSVETSSSHGSIGPNARKSATTPHEQRQVKSSGTVMNPRKRVSHVEQPGNAGAKHLKTSESMSPAPNLSGKDHGNACGLGLSESRTSTASPVPSLNALQAASEWIKNAALGGSTSILERVNGEEPSGVCPRQNTLQGQLDSSLSKETRSNAPAVGMCSINMNPAEVDCQDAGQFTPTTALDMFSESCPVNDAQAACMDMNVSMSLHPCTPNQIPKSLNMPQSSATVATMLPRTGFQTSVARPSSTSCPSPNVVSQSFYRRAASKEKNILPIIYDTSKMPKSFCATISMVNQPCSLSIPEGVQPQEFVSPAIQPSMPASTLSSQEKHLFKAARKFVITNGRVSIMDTHRHKDAMQTSRQSVHTNMQHDEDQYMHSNQTVNKNRNGGGKKQQVPEGDAMRQQYESIAKALGIGRASSSGCNDEHELAATAKLLTEMRAPAAQRTEYESR